MSEPMICPYCSKSYKTPHYYYRHVDSCTASPERQKFLAKVSDATETIEAARLTAKSLPEFLYVVSNALLPLGVTISFEHIPTLDLLERGYGYRDIPKAVVSVPENLLARGYSTRFVSRFDDLCRSHCFIKGFPNLEQFRWAYDILNALPTVKAMVEKDPAKQIDEYTLKVNKALREYDNLIDRETNSILDKDPIINKAKSLKHSLEKAMRDLTTISRNREKEISASLRNNRLDRRYLATHQIPEFFATLSNMDVDKFAKEQLEEVIAIAEKATNFINQHPEANL